MEKCFFEVCSRISIAGSLWGIHFSDQFPVFGEKILSAQ